MKTMTLKSRWSRWVSVLLAGVLIVALAGVAQPAAALSWSPKQCTGFSSCNKAGKGNAGYEKVYRKSFWGMNPGHNCTNYVAYRLQKNGVARFTNPGKGDGEALGGPGQGQGAFGQQVESQARRCRLVGSVAIRLPERTRRLRRVGEPCRRHLRRVGG